MEVDKPPLHAVASPIDFTFLSIFAKKFVQEILLNHLYVCPVLIDRICEDAWCLFWALLLQLWMSTLETMESKSYNSPLQISIKSSCFNCLLSSGTWPLASHLMACCRVKRKMLVPYITSQSDFYNNAHSPTVSTSNICSPITKQNKIPSVSQKISPPPSHRRPRKALITFKKVVGNLRLNFWVHSKNH